MPVRVPITHTMLQWAINNSGMSIDDLSRNPDLKHLESWLDGSKQPTVKQAKTLATKAHTQFPVLLLENPPENTVELPDFRTVGSTEISNPSPELRQVIEDCRLRLQWYVEYAEEFGLEFTSHFPHFSLADDPEESAQKMRSFFGWEPGKRSLRDQAAKSLSDLIEESGVLVMRSSMVRNNTHRPLDIEEFRGFTLLEDGFALIFINTQDSRQAQLFSLAHELGHVTLRQPGVSLGERTSSSPKIEPWCNRFAAEFLLPADYVFQEWTLGLKDEDVISQLSNRTGVSLQATVWRSVNLGFLDQSRAEELIRQYGHKAPKKIQGGGHGILNMRPRLGNRFLAATSDALGTDLLNLRDAIYYLGVSNAETAHKLLNSTREAA